MKSIPVRDRRPRVCAVCGDKTQINVMYRWKRDFDQKVFNVCAACAEENKQDSVSVDNYTHLLGAHDENTRPRGWSSRNVPYITDRQREERKARKEIILGNEPKALALDKLVKSGTVLMSKPTFAIYHRGLFEEVNLRKILMFAVTTEKAYAYLRNGEIHFYCR